MKNCTHCECQELPGGTGPHIKVGIFWSVSNTLVGDAVCLQDADEYGDALQHGAHYEFWEALKPKTEAERELKAHAYDYYPRGRIVFFPKRQTVRLYADSCIDYDDALVFFEYQKYSVEIEYDEHYQCAECNPYFLDEENSHGYSE